MDDCLENATVEHPSGVLSPQRQTVNIRSEDAENQRQGFA
jgi:hypothetical protein